MRDTKNQCISEKTRGLRRVCVAAMAGVFALLAPLSGFADASVPPAGATAFGDLQVEPQVIVVCVDDAVSDADNAICEAKRKAYLACINPGRAPAECAGELAGTDLKEVVDAFPDYVARPWEPAPWWMAGGYRIPSPSEISLYRRR